MSKRTKRHLSTVPAGAAAQPARFAFEQLDIPTGGRRNIAGLLYELANVAFPGSLAGIDYQFDRQLGSRCTITVATHEKFGADQVDAGRNAILRALVALGILKVAKSADPAPPTDAKTPEDGAQSPPQAPQLPPT